jgi:hypothetical protein
MHSQLTQVQKDSGRLPAKTPGPGFPLQSFGCAKRISAAIPGAWAKTGRRPRNILACLILACAAPLCAQNSAPKPEDFAGRVSLSAREGRLMHLELPETVYRLLARAGQKDICVFDSGGTPVPFEIRPAPRVNETPPPLEVPFFPWTAGEDNLPGQVNIEIAPDGAVISVHSRGNTSPAKTSSYLVDLSGLPRQPESLLLEMRETPEPWNSFAVLRFSENLSGWQSYGGRQALAFLEQDSPANRSALELPGNKAPYILLTTGENSPPLLKVKARFRARTRPETLRETVLPGTKSEDGFSVSYTAEGFYPVAALDFLLSGADSIDVEILRRSSEEEPWSFWNSGTIFRIGEGENMKKNKPWTGPAPYPCWKISSRGGVPFASVPGMLLVWEPLRLVFLARGKGPWILAFGNPGFTLAGSLPLQFQEQETLPASIIAGSEILRQPAPQIPAREPAWKHWLLWGALILAVAALSAMAWRLARLMRKQE